MTEFLWSKRRVCPAATPVKELEAARKHEIKLSVKPVEVCIFPADFII